MNDPESPRPRGACCAGKPIWTLRALAGVLPGLPGHLLRVAPTVLGTPISNALRERVMLAVAAENRCRYCQLAHGVIGQAAGESRADIARILDGDDSGLAPREALALAFARDLARRCFASRDEGLWDRLGREFTDAERDAIEATAHTMNFANRFGNTFDAALDRLLGHGGDGAPADASAVDLAVVSGAFVAAAAAVAPAIGALKLALALGGR